MKFILGTKLGMTQVFRNDGTVVPVTRVAAGPCVVTQVKDVKKDGVNAVQIGFGDQKKFRLNKAQKGHLKDLATVRFMREIATKEDEHGLKRGDVFTVKIFTPGEKVKVTGKSKGRGFQGVVKRHGFHGAPASHGHKDQERMPGSIGATDAARVFKGTRMGGHMGDAQVTVTNLEVVEIDPENNELLIKGAVPGARGGLLTIATNDGNIEVAVEEVKESASAEAPADEGEKVDEAPVAEEKKESTSAKAPADKEEPKTEEKVEEKKEEDKKEEEMKETASAEDSADKEETKTDE